MRGSSLVSCGRKMIASKSFFARYCLLVACGLLLLFAAGALSAQSKPAAAPLAKEPPPFNPSMLDRKVDPCIDFYAFSCGKWMAESHSAGSGKLEPIWQVRGRNRQILRDILERVSAPNPQRSAVMQKIGDYYAACMDEKAIDEKGMAPLKAEMDRIAKLSNKAGLATGKSWVSCST